MANKEEASSSVVCSITRRAIVQPSQSFACRSQFCLEMRLPLIPTLLQEEVSGAESGFLRVVARVSQLERKASDLALIVGRSEMVSHAS